MNPITRVLSDVAASRLFRSVEVAGVDDPAAGFRVLRLAGADLRGVSWVPGQKVQVRLEGFTTRTYTPMWWDPDLGETEVLAFMHGTGPGSAFLSELEVGRECQFFGPRSSIDLTKVSGVPLLVGDETSFGLAAAWQRAIGSRARWCFEAQDPATARQVLEQVGIHGAEIVAAADAPGADEAAGLEHLVEAAMGDDPKLHLVLTGRAQTIRRVRAALKESGRHAGPKTIKAYWDENRSGLD